MKSVVCAIVILTAVIGGSIISTIQIHNLSDELCQINVQMTEAVANDDFDGAQEIISMLSDKLKNSKKFLGAFINHNEMDNIELTLAKLRVFLLEEDTIQCLANCEILATQLEHIPKDFKVNLENIT